MVEWKRVGCYLLPPLCSDLTQLSAFLPPRVMQADTVLVALVVVAGTLVRQAASGRHKNLIEDSITRIF